MPDHNFEKNIQDKMSELKLQPSTPVWERLEVELDKKEKAKRRFLWIPLALVAACLSGFLIFTISNQSSLVNKPAGKEVASLKMKFKNASPLNPASKVARETASVKQTDIEGSAQLKDQRLQRSADTLVITTDEDIENRKQTHTDATPSVSNHVRDRKMQRNVFKGEMKQPAQMFEPEEALVSNKNLQQQAAVSIKDDDLKYSVIDAQRLPYGSIDMQPPASGLSNLSLRKKGIRRWQPGVVVKLGRSSLNSGQLFSLLSPSADASPLSFNSPTGTATNPTGNPGGIFIPPSSLTPAAAISAGGNISRQLSTGLVLSVGLNYQLYTTTQMLGYRKDSTINRLSATTQMNDRTSVYTVDYINKYNNRFHFIELPVSFQTRLFRTRLPVYWDAGFSISRLIATNALHFDNRYRLYYNDNDLLTKTHLQIHTGFSARLFSYSKTPLVIGPEINYGVTNLLKNKQDQKHFFFMGFKAQLPINKRI